MYGLDDAFKLTIDKMFPPSKPELLDEASDEFAVPGYNHHDNLWEHLGKITKWFNSNISITCDPSSFRN